MKVLFQTATALFLAAAQTSPTYSQTTSGNKLLDSCTSENDIGKLSFCVGYIVGEIEGQNLGAFLFSLMVEAGMSADEFTEFANRFIFQHCIPPNVTNGQLKDVVVQYLIVNPAVRHESARSLVLEAYREAFPCSPG